ncbi:DNA repair protein RecN [Marinibaculum pumilum]|uniref:DNA repair protein RecN n=1 Tax=Marinibaculum pumilum TaxID=1766165 RepID=A0ABV7KZQ6_9PROT
MLTALDIADIVLIRKVTLAFGRGLAVLTGETGAGKSILLDALGLALGRRADAGLVRSGAAQGVVAASFAPPPGHPVHALLQERGLAGDPAEEGALILRRVVRADGGSRAFVNDQPVGVALLRELGELLVEVQGQHDARGLMDPSRHRDLLDEAAGAAAERDAVAQAWARRRKAAEALAALEEQVKAARAEEEWLRHTVGELDALDPQPGEEEELAARRTQLRNGAALADCLRDALAAVSGQEGVEARLSDALRGLERRAAEADGLFEGAVAACDRALDAAAEAVAALEQAGERLELDPAVLERVEERLFALRGAARKHQLPAEQLPAFRETLSARLAAVEQGDAALAQQQAALAEAEQAFAAAAAALTARRQAAAAALAEQVSAELPPLKLPDARFAIEVLPLPAEQAGPAGMDRVAFLVATNPGVAPAPLHKVASGGELSRLLLALNVVLTRDQAIGTMIFDEVDQGVGGATAAAVAERLRRVADRVQVLVVTHAPQVAAAGARHFRIRKTAEGGEAATTVEPLDDTARLEEVARMLSAAEITPEARAQAARLLAPDAAAAG